MPDLYGDMSDEEMDEEHNPFHQAPAVVQNDIRYLNLYLADTERSSWITVLNYLYHTQEQRDNLLAACEKAEWGGFDVYGPMCPVCGGLMAEGHRDNCKLGAAITRARRGTTDE